MQYDVLDEKGRRVANVDFAYPERRLAIELESWTYHSGKRRWERDLDRRNDLTEVNWRVIWARDSDLERPLGLVRRILKDFDENP
jgi:very-short-patch-repair endonuclease